MLENLFASLTVRQNRVECLSLATFLAVVRYFRAKLEPTRVKHLKVSHYIGKSPLAMLEINMKASKNLPPTNTIAYLALPSVTKEKSFIELAPRCLSSGAGPVFQLQPVAKCHKTFFAVTKNNLECLVHIQNFS
jgi:hypothetical protein